MLFTMRHVAVLVAAVLAIAVAACGDDSSGSGSTSESTTAVTTSDEGRGGILGTDVTETTGPNGEEPADVTQLSFTGEELARLRDGGYTAAAVWAATSPFIEAVQAGARDEFRRLGIDLVATSQANFDAAKQADQLQTVMSKDPDVVISTPVDPTTAAAAFDDARRAGTKLVFLSTFPQGYVAGEDFVGVVTDDLHDMGKRAADALADSLGGEGKVGVIYYDIPFYVTNQRDGAFATTIRNDHPGMTIEAEEGFTDPARVGDVANAMLAQNPDLDGIYVSWSGPAAQVLSSLRAAGNTTTRIVTLDLDDTVVVDMVQGGQVAAVVADRAYELGKGLADTAAYALLGKEAPVFSVVGAVTVTADNVVEAYDESLRQKPSQTVQDALK